MFGRVVIVLGFVLVAAATVPAGSATAELPSRPGTESTATPQRLFGDIQRLIDQAAPGDSIVVPGGVFRGAAPIIVDRSVTLIGSPTTILDGSDAPGIFIVSADSVVIRGFTLRDVGRSFMEDRAAIKVESAGHCLIDSNTFLNNFFAVYLAEVDGCVVRGNEISAINTSETYAGNGIHAWYSKRLLVADNQVSGHRDGIYFEFVEDSRVEGNSSSANLRYGLHFMFSDRCDYLENEFVENGAGVAVMYSEHVRVRDNLFSTNRGPAAYGFLLKEIDDAEVTGNRFEYNSVGMYLEGSNRIVVDRNVFASNGWALKLLANSEESSFAANDFYGNTFDVATNSRQTVGAFRGNYWDAYEGYDLDGDGIGDQPFKPVRLFSLVVEKNEPSVIMLGSLFVDLLDLAERLVPTITPGNLEDAAPRMRPVAERGQTMTVEVFR